VQGLDQIEENNKEGDSTQPPEQSRGPNGEPSALSSLSSSSRLGLAQFGN